MEGLTRRTPDVGFVFIARVLIVIFSFLATCFVLWWALICFLPFEDPFSSEFDLKVWLCSWLIWSFTAFGRGSMISRCRLMCSYWWSNWSWFDWHWEVVVAFSWGLRFWRDRKWMLDYGDLLGVRSVSHEGFWGVWVCGIFIWIYCWGCVFSWWSFWACEYKFKLGKRSLLFSVIIISQLYYKLFIRAFISISNTKQIIFVYQIVKQMNI